MPTRDNIRAEKPETAGPRASERQRLALGILRPMHLSFRSVFGAFNCSSARVKITNFPHFILALLHRGSFSRMSEEKQSRPTVFSLVSIIRFSWSTWPGQGCRTNTSPDTPPSVSPLAHLHGDPDKAAALTLLSHAKCLYTSMSPSMLTTHVSS